MSLKKLLAITIILLFIDLALAPGINAVVEKKNLPPRDEKLVRLLVTEYKPDGTRESKIVRLPESQASEMRERLKTVEDLDERLSIYKEYELISKDVTSDKLKEGMEERTKQLGLTNEKLKGMLTSNKILNCNNGPIEVLNYACEVAALAAYGLPLIIGLSFITARINFFLIFGFPIPPFLLPSFDLVDIYFAIAGYLGTTNGTLPDFYIELGPIFLMLVGFVGFSIASFLFILPTDFVGYAAMAYAKGKEFVGPPWQ